MTGGTGPCSNNQYADVHGTPSFFCRATTNLVALYGNTPHRAETLTINFSRSLERTKKQGALWEPNPHLRATKTFR
jgi:hypothetical protein